MTTKDSCDISLDRMRTYYWSKKLAELIKLLDMEDAALLISVFYFFPEEVSEDLEMIKATVGQETQSMVRQLLRWYDFRNWTEANGRDTESVEKEKPKLNICRWWAEKNRRDAEQPAVMVEVTQREEWRPMRDDIPF